MGVIDRLLSGLFGGGNVITETAEVFRVNAEAQAGREAALSQAALGQFAAEFLVERRGVFDRFMDAANRIPRPALALGTLGLFVTAMVDPVWFAERMQGIALVPEPLWWLLGAIVSFYFGARHQAKGQEFQRSIAGTLANAQAVTRNLAALRALEDAADEVAEDAGRADTGRDAATTLGATEPSDNAAVDEWRRLRDR